MGLTFKKLPLVEVVVRVALSDVIPMRLENLKLLAALESFGEAQLMPKAWSGIGGVGVIKPEGLPHGIVFRNRDSGIDTAIQSNLLAIKWSTDEPGNPAYCGFQTLSSAFEQLLSRVQQSIGAVASFACNMSYTSLIELEQPPTFEDVERYFSGLLPACALRSTLFHDINVSWREQSIDLRVQLNRVVSMDGRHGLRVSTTGGQHLENEDIVKAIHQNHQALETFFPKLLTETSKKEWEYSSGPT